MSVRAFELVPAIERVNLTSDKATTQIVCLECCGKNLYLGTDDCFVIHYLVEERVGQNGKVVFHNEKQGHKYLGLRKPVLQLKAASAITRILVLCDATLSLLNMLNLEPVISGAKVKGVSAFCLNDNPVRGNPFCVEICVATKKKSIQLFTVNEDRMIAMKEISTMEPPLSVSMDGMYVCIALASEYKMINVDTAHIQELFPFDPDNIKPIVTKITRDEYLLNASNALGVFALVNGISQRPPLQWTNNVGHVGFTHPYILALNDEFITVHSILDQQQKQTIPFVGGKCMGEFDGRVFVATSRDVYYLVAIPLEKQIQSLLTDRRVSEALELARNARKTGLSKENFNKMFRRIQQQAGFIEFSQSNFDEALELFKAGQLDAKELITLYPGLMPSNTTFARSVPPLHDIADVNQLARGDEAKAQAFKDFLLQYLEEARDGKEHANSLVEIDTALLKLYAELNSDALLILIETANHCDIADCIQPLQTYQRHYALGLLYSLRGDNDMALDVWTRIYGRTLQDNSFPGLDFIIQFLSNVTDISLVWKYVDWVMEQDEINGVKVFTQRPANESPSDRMKPELIVDYLARFPKAVIVYLEHLVFHCKLGKESFHTHLAVLYLDNVLQLMRMLPPCEQTKLNAARTRLRHLLQVSNLYRVQLLLGKVKETEMHAECAILYGKLEEHDKALRLLVHKLRDFVAAETYCIINSTGRDLVYRTRLFQTLLTVYLDPSNERRESFVAPAVSLLNNNRAEFDTVKVLQSIPDNWSIGLLHQFLTSSIRKSLDRSRTIRIQRMLERHENLAIKKRSIMLMKDPLPMAEDRLCAVCNRGFTDPAFLYYPNGRITHIHCGADQTLNRQHSSPLPKHQL